MIYNSVADICAANDEVRRRIVEQVASLNEAQQSFHPAAGAWSVAEIVEHLAIIEGNMVRLVDKLLGKVEELTLHMIQQDRENRELRDQMNKQTKENQELRERLGRLEKGAIADSTPLVAK